ncbi:MAG TPA: DUF6127 family protein [Novosphingobium sp.]|nr:DUF6127 family protein [Novosphingobium sp.]
MREDMLARLIAQGVEQGSDLVTLRALVEEASELGAGRMLARMGLGDARASDDMSELRQLLAAWREARRGAWRVLGEWLMRAVLALLLVLIAFRSDVTELLK